MPLWLKAEVVMKGEMIYTINIFKLYEYFYYFRKIRECQKRRQKLSKNGTVQKSSDSQISHSIAQYLHFCCI